ncbi:UBX domain-containing protein 1 [Sesamum indicum]|uniref:UBX domain-containing protein 1 n=1 Tax=Sesamum indicum TaxID=4182 RepID=A0A6I9U5H5_SESIN|nr:UBX domain-containing protein 1 [Sesamum indicum]
MEVGERLLRELEAMGFSKDQARMALSSGNSSIEAAIDWLADHENDTVTSETLAIPEAEVVVNINIEASDSFQNSEKVKLRAQELRNQARNKKANQEKKLEREREKARFRAGKELLEAKRTAEESERKRFLAQRKADKEEEKRAREKILQKLQQDKLERRGMLGKEATLPMNPDTRLPQTTKPVDALPVKHSAARERMRECLRSLKHQNKDDNAEAMRAFGTLLIYVKNIVSNPEEEKFRKIRLNNPMFQDRVGKFEQGIKFLELCGFERVEGGNFLLLCREKVDMGLLNLAGTELQSALTNPFFGLLSG